MRAHLRFARLPVERATYELRAAASRRVPEGKTRALVAALRRVAAGDGSGAHAWSDAWLHEDEESGHLHAVVLYGGRRTAGPTSQAPAPTCPEHDARCVPMPSRSAWGRRGSRSPRRARSAWPPTRPPGDARSTTTSGFLRAPSLTLKPLQVLGAAGLAAAKLPPEVQRARVIACQLDTGSAHRVEARGLDALTPLLPHLRAGGHLTHATLRFDIAGDFGQLDAVLQPPHRIDIGWAGVAGHAARGPRIAREALASLGLLSPGTMADDITTLLPLVDPEWRWRELVGDDGLAAMRAAGVLEEVLPEHSRRPAHPSMRHLGRSAIAFRLYRSVGPGVGRIDPDAPEHEKKLARTLAKVIEASRKYSDYYAVPDDWSIPAFTVSQPGSTPPSGTWPALPSP